MQFMAIICLNGMNPKYDIFLSFVWHQNWCIGFHCFIIFNPNIVNHEFWKLLFPNTYLGYHVCHSWNCFGFTLRYCIVISYPFLFYFSLIVAMKKPLIFPFFRVRLTTHFRSLISLNGSIPNRTCIKLKLKSV
jgi:hypothetical protein